MRDVFFASIAVHHAVGCFFLVGCESWTRFRYPTGVVRVWLAGKVFEFCTAPFHTIIL